MSISKLLTNYYGQNLHFEVTNCFLLLIAQSENFAWNKVASVSEIKYWGKNCSLPQKKFCNKTLHFCMNFDESDILNYFQESIINFCKT